YVHQIWWSVGADANQARYRSSSAPVLMSSASALNETWTGRSTFNRELDQSPGSPGKKTRTTLRRPYSASRLASPCAKFSSGIRRTDAPNSVPVSPDAGDASTAATTPIPSSAANPASGATNRFMRMPNSLLPSCPDRIVVIGMSRLTTGIGGGKGGSPPSGGITEALSSAKGTFEVRRRGPLDRLRHRRPGGATLRSRHRASLRHSPGDHPRRRRRRVSHRLDVRG